MEIYQVIHHSYMSYEYDTENVLFTSDSLDLAVDLAKKAVRTHVIGTHAEDEVRFSLYKNLDTYKLNIFKNSSIYRHYDFEVVFVIALELNAISPKKHNIVWEANSEFVFELFSADLDTCFNHSVIPTLELKDKIDLFSKLKNNVNAFNKPSNVYRGEVFNAADLLSITTDNINDLELYNLYEKNL